VKSLHIDEDSAHHARESLTWQEALNEVLVLKLLSPHRNIVQCYGLVRDLDNMRLLMYLEMAPFGTLSETLRDHDRFPCLPHTLTLSWLLDIASTLAYVHDKGVLYRDLNPDNVLLCAGLQVKLCDFGLSLESTDTLCGTRGYIPWEQCLDGLPASYASDVFAFGVTALQVFSRELRRPVKAADDLLRLVDCIRETTSLAVSTVAVLPTVDCRSAVEPREDDVVQQQTFHSLPDLLAACVRYEGPQTGPDFGRPTAETVAAVLAWWLQELGGDPRSKEIENKELEALEAVELEVACAVLQPVAHYIRKSLT
jgi:serine/threonine protein kinase